MDAGINNVIYMELNSGPKIAKSTCGKTIVAGMIDRGSTVLQLSLTWRKTVQQLLLIGHLFFPGVCDIVEMVIRKQIWCISLKIITNL